MYYETELYHHGIKGQKWGVRRFQNPDGSYTKAGLNRRNDGVPRSTERTAKKDAKEYARAKMYYGEGAGTRRKLINNTIKERSKDPAYKERLDYYISKQNMADHAAKARSERHRNDVKNAVSKTGRGLLNAATGNIGRASAGAAALYMAAHYTGLDRKVAEYGRQTINNIPNIVANAGKKYMDYKMMHKVF